MGTWGKRVLSRGNGQCKGPEEAGQYPVCLCNSEEAHVAGAEGMREGGEEVRQGGDKKDIVCRAVGSLGTAASLLMCCWVLTSQASGLHCC